MSGSGVVGWLVGGCAISLRRHFSFAHQSRAFARMKPMDVTLRLEARDVSLRLEPDVTLRLGAGDVTLRLVTLLDVTLRLCCFDVFFIHALQDCSSAICTLVV